MEHFILQINDDLMLMDQILHSTYTVKDSIQRFLLFLLIAFQCDIHKIIYQFIEISDPLPD